MTNAQVDHRKYVIFFYIDHRGGQFESLQGMLIQSILSVNFSYVSFIIICAEIFENMAKIKVHYRKWDTHILFNFTYGLSDIKCYK